MEERTIHLKIKVKNLADEARLNRAEARKASGKVKWNLNHHRTSVLRDHARHNLLAYGILRGVPYLAMEQKCEKAPDWDRVSKIAKRFGATDETVSRWVEAATGEQREEKVA